MEGRNGQSGPNKENKRKNRECLVMGREDKVKERNGKEWMGEAGSSLHLYWNILPFDDVIRNCSTAKIHPDLILTSHLHPHHPLLSLTLFSNNKFVYQNNNGKLSNNRMWTKKRRKGEEGAEESLKFAYQKEYSPSSSFPSLFLFHRVLSLEEGFFMLETTERVARKV